MEFKDKDLPSSGVDLLPILPASQNGGPASGENEFTTEDYRTALRMFVGAALEGSDELRTRIKTWLVNIQKGEQEIDASMLEEETGGSPLLYTLIGLLFKTPEYLSRATSTADRASTFVSRFAKPITHSWILRPVRQRYNVLVASGRTTFSSLEEIGRSEASSSRALIRQQVTDEAVEEFLTYMVEKSKMREMIEETTAKVGSDTLVEIRGRSAYVDSSLDKIVGNILRRNKPETPASDSSS